MNAPTGLNNGLDEGDAPSLIMSNCYEPIRSHGVRNGAVCQRTFALAVENGRKPRKTSRTLIGLGTAPGSLAGPQAVGAPNL